MRARSIRTCVLSHRIWVPSVLARGNVLAQPVRALSPQSVLPDSDFPATVHHRRRGKSASEHPNPVDSDHQPLNQQDWIRTFYLDIMPKVPSVLARACSLKIFRRQPSHTWTRPQPKVATLARTPAHLSAPEARASTFERAPLREHFRQITDPRHVRDCLAPEQGEGAAGEPWPSFWDALCSLGCD